MLCRSESHLLFVIDFSVVRQLYRPTSTVSISCTLQFLVPSIPVAFTLIATSVGFLLCQSTIMNVFFQHFCLFGTWTNIQPQCKAPHPLSRHSSMLHSRTGLSCSLLPLGVYIINNKVHFVNGLPMKILKTY